MAQSQSTADVFETAANLMLNQGDWQKSRKIFQHGSIDKEFLLLERCDFLRGVGMSESQDPSLNRTTSLSIARVARSIDYYGLYANESKTIKDFSTSQNIPEGVLPTGLFQANQMHQYSFSFWLSTPGRWCAAAALDLIDDGQPAAMEKAHELLIKGYQVDKISEGKHQILDLAMALLHTRAELYDQVIKYASPYSSLVPDWGHWENAPSVNENGETTTMQSDLARALLATAHAHLGQFDNALAYAETAMTNATAQAQSFFIQACIARAKGKEEDEVNRLFANAEAANPNREDIKKAHNDSYFLLRQTTPEMIAKRTSMWDVATEPSLAASQAMEAEAGRKSIVEEALAELDSYIGLASVKEEIHNLANKIALDKKREELGGKAESSNLSVTFQGPPGVGKTSIARIYHKILYGFGILKNDAFVEVDRSNLIGQYQGQTVERTRGQLSKADGGTFFLDEAYSLVQNENDMYGNESLDAIVKYMEDNSGKMCVILAGYKDDMSQLLKRNEGLSSRFKQHVEFPSYSPAELTQIVEVIAKRKNKTLAPGALEAVEEILTNRLIRESDGEYVTDVSGITLVNKMGNGRGARNIVEEADPISAKRLQDYPTENITLELLNTYTVEDMVEATNTVIDRIIKI